MLDVYRLAAFDDETCKCDPVVTAVGALAQTVFDVSPLTNLTIGDSIQVGDEIRYRVRGAWSISGSLVTFASAPAVGIKITFSGRTYINVSAYDQSTVPGVVNPLEKEFEFFLQDNNEIHAFEHVAAPDKEGIEVSFFDYDALNGNDETWYQLARMLGDGTPDTYEAAGDPLLLPDINIITALDGDVEADDSVITLLDATGLEEGMLVTFGYGTGSKEVRRIREIDGNDITVSPLEFDHADEDPVYHSGYALCGKLIVPEDVAENTPTSLRAVFPLVTFDSNMRF